MSPFWMFVCDLSRVSTLFWKAQNFDTVDSILFFFLNLNSEIDQTFGFVDR